MTAEPAIESSAAALTVDFRPGLRRLAWMVIAWAIASLTVAQVTYAFERGNDLSEYADAHSESNEVRAGQGFAERGFTSNGGLADIDFGDQFPHNGGKIDKHLCPETFVMCVYFHNPPGSEWIMGVLTKIFGVGKIPLYRLFYIALGTVAMCVLAGAIAAALDPVRAAMAMVFLHGVPMFSNMMHGLFHSTGFSMLLFEYALSVHVFRKPRALSRGAVVTFGLLGFLQGWLTFEHVFLVTFAPLVLALLFVSLGDAKERRRVLFCVLAAGGGFALAHALHFVQIAHYLGGVKAMIAHFKGVADARSGSTEYYNWDKFAFPGRIGVVAWVYLTIFANKYYYDGSFVTFLATVIAVCAWGRPLLMPVGDRLRLHMAGGRGPLLAILASLAVSSAWLVLMPAHASIHPHFIPRLLFLALFTGTLAFLKTFDVSIAPPRLRWN